MRWLLLTASVTPDPNFTVAINDPRLRRAQYVAALSAWQKDPVLEEYGLILLENTGADLDALLADANMRASSTVRPIACASPSPSSTSGGKGAAEASMLDYALGLQGLIDDNDLVVKVTGRLYVRRLEHLLRRRRSPASITLRTTLDLSYADTRLFAMNGDLFRRAFSGMGAMVREQEGKYLEHVLAMRTVEARFRHGAILSRFDGRPVFVGSSGTSGSDYFSSRTMLRHVSTAPVEAILRRVSPDKQF